MVKLIYLVSVKDVFNLLISLYLTQTVLKNSLWYLSHEIVSP